MGPLTIPIFVPQGLSNLNKFARQIQLLICVHLVDKGECCCLQGPLLAVNLHGYKSRVVRSAARPV